jgi:hypothetical protein
LTHFGVKFFDFDFKVRRTLLTGMICYGLSLYSIVSTGYGLLKIALLYHIQRIKTPKAKGVERKPVLLNDIQTPTTAYIFYELVHLHFLCFFLLDRTNTVSVILQLSCFCCGGVPQMLICNYFSHKRVCIIQSEHLRLSLKIIFKIFTVLTKA